MKKNRAFLKWAGGKYSLIEDIRALLPEGDTLIEPFVGAGSVFLNCDYRRYILNDINPDLINLYQILVAEPARYISEARRLFLPEFNARDQYYALRQQFNLSQDPFERSVLFLYLNRHGYNGLCRYNKRGGFNVPFGNYKRPYFPEAELLHFAERGQRATFTCLPFTQVMAQALPGQVIYCDPPYAPLSATASFTSYAGQGFGSDDQHALAVQAAQTAVQQGVPVLISNHDIAFTRDIYQGSQISTLEVKRSISCKGRKRVKVGEMLALFSPSSIPPALPATKEPAA